MCSVWSTEAGRGGEAQRFQEPQTSLKYFASAYTPSVGVGNWWWRFDWSVARVMAPVVTTTSVILSSNKSRLETFWYRPTQVHLEKMAVKPERERHPLSKLVWTVSPSRKITKHGTDNTRIRCIGDYSYLILTACMYRIVKYDSSRVVDGSRSQFLIWPKKWEFGSWIRKTVDSPTHGFCILVHLSQSCSRISVKFPAWRIIVGPQGRTCYLRERSDS